MVDNHRKRLTRIMPKLSTLLPQHQALTDVTGVNRVNRVNQFRSLLALTLSLALSQPVSASTTVALAGLSGDKALLIVDNNPPRFVSVGQTLHQVRLMALDVQTATVEVDGQRRTLRLGETPISVGSSGSAGSKGSGSISGKSIVLFANPQGHFLTQGRVNNQAIVFLVDTGASTVTLGRSDAKRAGIILGEGKGTVVRAQTANGSVNGWKTELSTVHVGALELRDVTAIVLPHDMPFALLGNSFLSQFRMQRDGQQLVLERRF